MLNETINLPDELKSARFIDANQKMISGITKGGALFSYNPVHGYSKELSKVTKFVSNTARLCAITGDNNLVCYTKLRSMDLHLKMKVKV